MVEKLRNNKDSIFWSYVKCQFLTKYFLGFVAMPLQNRAVVCGGWSNSSYPDVLDDCHYYDPVGKFLLWKLHLSLIYWNSYDWYFFRDQRYLRNGKPLYIKVFGHIHVALLVFYAVYTHTEVVKFNCWAPGILNSSRHLYNFLRSIAIEN